MSSAKAYVSGHLSCLPPIKQWPPAALLEAITQSCRAHLPNEACGAWSHCASGQWRYHPLSNQAPAAQRSQHFSMDPLGLLQLLEAQDAGQLTLHGLYHSHPLQSPAMSKADREGLLFAARPAYPHLLHLIVGFPLAGPPSLALYHWDSPSNQYLSFVGDAA